MKRRPDQKKIRFFFVIKINNKIKITNLKEMGEHIYWNVDIGGYILYKPLVIIPPLKDNKLNKA